MLDTSIVNQLREIFSKLDHKIQLAINPSEHAKFQELEDMLTEVAATSSKIEVTRLDQAMPSPRFEVHCDGEHTGIAFSGIPGGHEFNSLILAILNADGKGKLPDEMIQRRIKALKGKISLKTYISLSCENCPDIVQALNIMSIYKKDFSHEMVDGEFFQEDITRLKIQGVPSVVDGDELVHSGKSSLIDLLTKLEQRFGAEKSAEPIDLGDFDVVVVGGGPAGASAAIYTARKGLSTVIIADRMGGQLMDTKGIENHISVSYTEGPKLSQNLMKHIEDYDIKVLENRRVTKVDEGARKELELDSGEKLRTRSLIVTTGAKWRELNIPGEKDYLGRGVAFCPHCDGPYYKGKDISVIGGGNSGVEAAIDLANIVKHVTLIEFAPELKADSVLVKKLESLKNVTILRNARTHKVKGNGDKVTGLEYENRATGKIEKIDLDGVFVQIGLTPNSGFIKNLVETNAYGEIVINEKCRTSAKNVYAAGDVTTVPFKQIVVAIGEGAKAGLSAFEDLMLQEA